MQSGASRAVKVHLSHNRGMKKRCGSCARASGGRRCIIWLVRLTRSLLTGLSTTLTLLVCDCSDASNALARAGN